jgi:hypothetical protein
MNKITTSSVEYIFFYKIEILWFQSTLRVPISNLDNRHFSDMWDRTYGYLPDSSWSFSPWLPRVIQKQYTVKREVKRGGGGRSGRESKRMRSLFIIENWSWGSHLHFQLLSLNCARFSQVHSFFSSYIPYLLRLIYTQSILFNYLGTCNEEYYKHRDRTHPSLSIKTPNRTFWVCAM